MNAEEKLQYLLKEIESDIEFLEQRSNEANAKYIHHLELWKNGSDSSDNMNFWEGKHRGILTGARKLKKLKRMLEGN